MCQMTERPSILNQRSVRFQAEFIFAPFCFTSLIGIHLKFLLELIHHHKHFLLFCFQNNVTHEHSEKKKCKNLYSEVLLGKYST